MTTEQIIKIASRKGVKKIAVENFLMSLDGMNKSSAMANLKWDAKLYNWNATTQKAILTGINKHYLTEQ